jgi:DNA-binding FrmR family transcriptional regulator
MKRLHREQDKKALILRLKRVEGQLRGLQRLIEDDAPCESVAQQLSAARRALDTTFHSLVRCLIESQLSGKGNTRTEIKHAVEILSRYS